MRREGASAVPHETAALCLLLAINTVDLLPNSALLPLTWLIAGSLLGYAERTQEEAPMREETKSTAQ